MMIAMGCYVLVVLVVPSTVIAFRCAVSSIVGHNRYSISRSHRTMERYRLRRDDDNDYSPSTDNEFDDEFDKRFATLESSKKSPIFSGNGKWQIINKAILAGMFIAGIGTGITIDSAINTNPKDLASRDSIDRNAPNPKLCATYGSSAMVFDQRIFVTFNPFNVYVTQADTKPGCVLRQSNVVQQLQNERQLISDVDMANCKNSFNTWGFIGDINSKPQLNCLYQSDDAQNEFLSNPKIGLGEDIYEKDLKSK